MPTFSKYPVSKAAYLMRIGQMECRELPLWYPPYAIAVDDKGMKWTGYVHGAATFRD